jgi:hypothetical protein
MLTVRRDVVLGVGHRREIAVGVGVGHRPADVVGGLRDAVTPVIGEPDPTAVSEKSIDTSNGPCTSDLRRAFARA